MSTEENQSQGSGIKRRKMDSAVPAQMDIITEPENDGSLSAQMDIITEPKNDISVTWDIMSDPEDDSFDVGEITSVRNSKAMLFHSDNEMSTEAIKPSMGYIKSKEAKNKKAFRGHPCLWCFSRRALWHLFRHQSRTRRQRRIRVVLRRRGSKITKTTDNSYLDNQGQGSRSKRRKMDSAIPVQRDIITEPENDSSVPWNIMSDPEDDSFDDYCKPADIRSLWRPPKPKEDGIWVPSCVKTNGEGRVRLGDPDRLVEIFDIEVDLRARTKTYGNIHGNIMLSCFGHKTVLFNCDKKSALMIQQKVRIHN